MKRLFIILIGLISLCTIGFKFMHLEEIPENEEAVNELLSVSTMKLKKKYKMRPSGTGVAMPGGVVKKLGLDFHITGPLSKDDIRKILVHSAQDFLSYINADKEIRPYLDHFPFEMNNVELTLFLNDSQGTGLSNPHVGIAAISTDELEYDYLVDHYEKSLNINMPKIIKKEKESYQEALKALQAR